MKSRHTPMKGKLSRSFGFDDTEDLVVELNAEGFVAFRREPNDRKLKRGEQLPEVRLDVRDMCSDLSVPKPAAQEDEMVAILERVAGQLTVRKFEEEPPKNLAHTMKFQLLDMLKQAIADQKEFGS